MKKYLMTAVVGIASLMRKRILQFLAVFWALLSSYVMAAPFSLDSSPGKYIQQMAGDWYDSSGQLVLSIQGKTINGCAIIGAQLIGEDLMTVQLMEQRGGQCQ